MAGQRPANAGLITVESYQSGVSIQTAAAAVGVTLQTGPVDQFVTAVVDAVVALDRAALEVTLAARHPAVTKVMTSVTGLGSATAALVFLGLARLAGWRRELRATAASLAIAGVVVGSLMLLVQRPFPPQPVCLTDGGGLAHSFPSGHAAAVTVYALVARESPTLPFAPVAGLAALIAVSRVYLGTHYLSDTLVGVGIGVGAFVAGTALLRRVDV
nr:phosphatase PAP2 family protein [Halomicroarcula sp. GDY20]